VRKGLPFSLIIHAILLVGTFVYGAHVNPPPIQQRQIIKVHLTQALPRQTAPEVEPEIIPDEVEPAPPPEPEPPEPEPRKVPEKLPEEEKVAEPVETEPEKPSPDPPAEETSEPAPALTELPEGPKASSTDEPFPFAWYLNLVEGRISRHWKPRQLGFSQSGARSCAVHFFVERGGAITRVTLVQESGVSLFDREAVRAVQAAHPLPPLPTKFASRSLGVTIVFTLRSGL
jgi:TonB family protein